MDLSHFFLLIFLLIKELSCFSQYYTNLYNWLISNGAFISKKIIPVEHDIYNRYIKSTDIINKNEEIIFIPNELTLSTLNSKVSEVCNFGFKEYNTYATKEEKFSYDFDCLVYFLTIDINNTNSFFVHFYNYFPEISKNDFPLYFPEEKISLLEQIELDSEIQRQKYFFNKSLNPVKNEILKIKNGLEKFRQNFILVSTRNLERRNSFFEEVNTLVPFLDLLNHNNDFNAWFFYDEKREGFSLYTIKNIDKNEEITISYGKLNNVYLYSIYGFTIKDNIYKANINLKLFGKKITLFPNNKQTQIKKVIKLYKDIDERKLIAEFKKSLVNRLNEYQNVLSKFKNDINIINICNDLISTVKEYISLSEKLFLSN